MDEASATDETTESSSVRVFVSYAWEDDECRTLVKRLAARLTDDGVN